METKSISQENVLQEVSSVFLTNKIKLTKVWIYTTLNNI